MYCQCQITLSNEKLDISKNFKYAAFSILEVSQSSGSNGQHELTLAVKISPWSHLHFFIVIVKK